MKIKIQSAFAAACLLAFFQVAWAESTLPTLPAKPELPMKTDASTKPGVPTSPSAPKAAAVAPAANPSPELVGELTKGLGITPEQAVGGSGALFGLAKSRLKPEEFGKVASAVPGMDGLLAAAPQSPMGGGSALGSVTSALPGAIGGLAPVAGAFKSLGLSPEMAAQFVPILTNFVGGKGGAGTASLLTSAFK